MKEEELKRSKELHEIYNWSRSICDPVDYSYRQSQLVQAMAKYLLSDYENYLQEKVKKEYM